MVPDCLPANIPVVIRLHRAPSSYLLLKTSETIEALKADNTKHQISYSYEEPVIPILAPVLNAYYANSVELESKMNKGRLYNNSINFLDYQTRRQVLDQGLSEFQINLQMGKFPKYMFLSLSETERIGGSEEKSLTKFQQHDLDSIDVLVGEQRFFFYNITRSNYILSDQESVLGFPLKGRNFGAIQFYENFLEGTNGLMNPYSSGVLNYHDFLQSNFIILVNFEKLHIESGMVQLKLKFDSMLSQKLVLLWVPVTEKKLIFSPDSDVTVE